MKLTFHAGRTYVIDKDMGDATIYPKYGYVDVRSDLILMGDALKTVAVPSTLGGGHCDVIPGSSLHNALAAALPFLSQGDRTLARFRLAQLATWDTGSNFSIGWKLGYARTDEDDSVVTVPDFNG